ncbi:hypothetical protein K469DRAFT_699231 [Zopfia rhizophila CBS 207.26]|uniref:Uncharacterized protein n=1 Tax=Zopfia rhizophila CBS 207.26 TaxID=1314779 RepID=A0A6A6EU26_9PEZI|nr:hypothetical protein K469DRAFT_699231 [Zopfia rhizophila CBS 207.26]
MPALPFSRDSSSLQSDSLAPRSLSSTFSSLISRQPATKASSSSAIALNALSERVEVKRQVVPTIIPTYYNFNGPAPGTVVGIVLGSVAGFLLIVWLLYSLTNLSGGAAIAGEEEIVVRRRRSRSPHSRRSRRSTRTEVREYSRSPRRREPVVVEERRTRPRPRSVIVEERVRVPGDDVVEVIEEHDDYRSRRDSRRSGGYRY